MAGIDGGVLGVSWVKALFGMGGIKEDAFAGLDVMLFGFVDSLYCTVLIVWVDMQVDSREWNIYFLF